MNHNPESHFPGVARPDPKVARSTKSVMSALRLAPSVDLLSRKVATAYSPKLSLDYRIALISAGAKKYSYRGKNLVAQDGSIVLAEPGLVHAGEPVHDSFDVKMLSLAPSAFETFVLESCRTGSSLLFPQPVIIDQEVSRELRALVDSAERGADPVGWRLYCDEALQTIVGLLLARHAGRLMEEPIRQEHQAVVKVLRLIHDLYDRPLSLDELAHEGGLPKYRFLRAFRAECGLPPHHYQLQFRLGKAKFLIARGETLSQVALSCGFYDQSHFHRHFTRIIGLSPREYQKATAPRGANRTR